MSWSYIILLHCIDCVLSVFAGDCPPLDRRMFRRCDRWHRWRAILYREQIPANKKEHNQCNATIWCMIMTWKYAMIWANATRNQIKWSWFEPKVQIFSGSKSGQRKRPFKRNKDGSSSLDRILDRPYQIHGTPDKPTNHTSRSCWVFKHASKLNAEHKEKG